MGVPTGNGNGLAGLGPLVGEVVMPCWGESHVRSRRLTAGLGGGDSPGVQNVCLVGPQCRLIRWWWRRERSGLERTLDWVNIGHVGWPRGPCARERRTDKKRDEGNGGEKSCKPVRTGERRHTTKRRVGAPARCSQRSKRPCLFEGPARSCAEKLASRSTGSRQRQGVRWGQKLSRERRTIGHCTLGLWFSVAGFLVA